MSFQREKCNPPWHCGELAATAPLGNIFWNSTVKACWENHNEMATHCNWVYSKNVAEPCDFLLGSCLYLLGKGAQQPSSGAWVVSCCWTLRFPSEAKRQCCFSRNPYSLCRWQGKRWTSCRCPRPCPNNLWKCQLWSVRKNSTVDLDGMMIWILVSGLCKETRDLLVVQAMVPKLQYLWF